MHTRSGTWVGLLVVAAGLVSWPARADILPQPERPRWEDEPAPLPELPEKQLPVPAPALGLVVVAALWAWRTGPRRGIVALERRC